MLGPRVLDLRAANSLGFSIGSKAFGSMTDYENWRYEAKKTASHSKE
jgi:hypothetical protein